MEHNSVERNNIQHHRIGNGRIVSPNNNSMSTSRVLVGNTNTGNHRPSTGNGKIGAPPAIPTSSREAQLLYYPWKATAAVNNTTTAATSPPPHGANQHQNPAPRQPQYSAVSSPNNTSFSALMNHQPPPNSATSLQQPVSFVTTTKPSSFAVNVSSDSSIPTETYENVPTSSPTSSSVPFLSYISSPHAITSARNISSSRPATTSGSTTMVSLGQHHAMSTVPPVAIYTGGEHSGTPASSSSFTHNMPARLLPASHAHHHHHHNHLYHLLGGDLLSSHPNTSATFLSSSKDARVGFQGGNTPPQSPTQRSSFDMSANKPDDNVTGNITSGGRTSRGSVAERVLWFEGFPQAAPLLSSSNLVTSAREEGDNAEGAEVQVVHYTTHEHRGLDGGAPLVRSRSRRIASSSGGYDLRSENRDTNAFGGDDEHFSSITETRTIPKSGSSLPPQQLSYTTSPFSSAGRVPNDNDTRSGEDFTNFRPSNTLLKPNGVIRTQPSINFRPPSFSSGNGLHEATFPLVSPAHHQLLRGEQPRVVPMSLELTSPTQPAFSDINFSTTLSPPNTSYQQLPNNSHARLQQSASVIEHPQPHLSYFGSRSPAGPGTADSTARHNRSQSIPALTSTSQSPNNSTTPHQPSPYMASYKRQHEQLQRTGLQQILDSLDFNKLIDEVHGRAFGAQSSLLSPLGPASPSSTAPTSLLQPPNFASSSAFNNARSPPSWASRPFTHTQRDILHSGPDSSFSMGGEAQEVSTTAPRNDVQEFAAGPPPPPPRRLSSAARSLMLSEEHWPFSSAFGKINHPSLLQPPGNSASNLNNARNRNTVERTIPIMVSDGPATPLRTAASRNKTPPPPSAVAAAVAAAAKQKLAATTPSTAPATSNTGPAVSHLPNVPDEVIAPSPSTLLIQQQQHEQHERVLPTAAPSTAMHEVPHHLHHNTLSSALKEATGTVPSVAVGTASAAQPKPIVPIGGTGRQLPHAPLVSTAAALHVPIPTPNADHRTPQQQTKLPEKAGKLHVIPAPAAAPSVATNLLRPNVAKTELADSNAVPVSDNTANGKQPSLLSDQHAAVAANYNTTTPTTTKSQTPTPSLASEPRAPVHRDAQRSTQHYHPYNTAGKPSNKFSSHNVIIPRFYYPRGKPMASDVEAEFNEYVMREKLQRYFQGRHEMFTLKDMAIVAKVVQVPHYWKAALFKAFGGVKETDVVAEDTIISTWKRVVHQNFDEEARFLALLAKPGTHHLEPSDFALLIQDIVDEHPGLNILKEAPEFHARYINTVISRIYYEINRSWSGKITLTELRRSKLMQVLRVLEKESDINLITDFFSYEHFYVIYCKFWELDQDHDLVISREDLARHHEGAMNPLIVERIFSGAVTRGEHQKRGQMNYPEFVWFLLAEEDKRNPRSIEYWFRCMDLDGDGYLTLYELEYFYAKQAERMKELGLEPLSFCDIATQMFDMIKPKKHPRCICLSDLKRNVKLTPIFFDTFTNLEKYILHEHRDPFANSKHLEDPELEGLSDWCKYAAEEYEYLVSEEAASANSSANDTPSATPTNFTTLTAMPSSPAAAANPDESSSFQPVAHFPGSKNANENVLNSTSTTTATSIDDSNGHVVSGAPPPAAASSV